MTAAVPVYRDPNIPSRRSAHPAPPPPPRKANLPSLWDGQLLRDARKARKLSQQQLADLLGVHQPTVCDWEKSFVEPSFSYVVRIARLLDVPVTAFVPAE